MKSFEDENKLNRILRSRFRKEEQKQDQGSDLDKINEDEEGEDNDYIDSEMDMMAEESEEDNEDDDNSSSDDYFDQIDDENDDLSSNKEEESSMAIGHSVANLEYDSEQDDEYYDEESSSDNSSYPSDNGRDVFELIPIQEIAPASSGKRPRSSASDNSSPRGNPMPAGASSDSELMDVDEDLSDEIEAGQAGSQDDDYSYSSEWDLNNEDADIVSQSVADIDELRYQHDDMHDSYLQSMSRTYSNEGASHYSVRSGNSWGLIDRLSPAFRAGFNGLDSLQGLIQADRMQQQIRNRRNLFGNNARIDLSGLFLPGGLYNLFSSIQGSNNGPRQDLNNELTQISCIGGSFKIFCEQMILMFKKELRNCEAVYLTHSTNLFVTSHSQQQENENQEENKDENDEEQNQETKNRNSVAQKQKSEQQAKQPQTRGQPNILDFEGVDPLFMETLSPRALQSIADTHQLHQQIQNQAQQVSYNVDQINTMQSNQNFLSSYLMSLSNQRRQEVLQQIRTNENRDLSSDLFGQLQQFYHNNREQFNRLISYPGRQGQPSLAQQPSRNQRDRLMSFDSLNISMDSITALLQSRRENLQNQAQPPQRAAINQEQVQQQAERRNAQRMLNFVDLDKTLRPDTHKKEDPQSLTSLRKSKFVKNFYNILKTINRQQEMDPQGKVCDKQCETLLNQAFNPTENEPASTQYDRVRNLVEIAMQSFKMVNQEETQMPSVQFLLKTPNLRICLILKVLSLMNQEVANLENHAMKFQEEKLSYLSKHQNWQIKNLKTAQPMSMFDILKLVFSVILTVQDDQPTILTRSKMSSTHIKEQILPLEENSLHQQFAELIGDIDASKSILDSLIETSIKYFQLTTQHPWLLTQDESTPQVRNLLQEKLMESIFTMLDTVYQEVRSSRKKNKEQLELTNLPILKVSELILGPQRVVKLSKVCLMQLKRTLNKIQDDEIFPIVIDYIKQRVYNQLQVVIAQLCLRRKDKQQVLNPDFPIEKLEQFKPQLEQFRTLSQQIELLSEYLKIANFTSKLKKTNVCDQNQLISVLNVAERIIQAEEQQNRARKSSSLSIKSEEEKENQQNPASSAYMFKDEIKELLLLLFSLCGYNLQIMLMDKKEEKKDVTQQEIQNSQKSIEERKETSMQIQTQPSSIEKYLEEIVQKHMTANSIDLEQFRSLIGFFIRNKKLINTFVRVNNQVINTDLKNLAMLIPDVLEFDTKRFIWRAELKKLHSKHTRREELAVQVRRDHVFDDSFDSLRDLSNTEWKMRFAIEFKDEEGVDQGGLTKEWFMALSKQMFDENYTLFIKAASGSTYYPNPKSTVQPNYIELFEFVGKIVAKALWEQQLLDCFFVKAFYKIILGNKLRYEDLENYDERLFNSLKWLLEHDNVDQLCSYFVETIEYFGENKEIELCDGGGEKLVTDENKHEYVSLITNFRLYKAIDTQMDAFLRGFYSIIPKDLIKIFDAGELQLLISGLQNIDIDDLRENTIYVGYTSHHKTIQLFWQALHEFDNSERAEFIQFVTGSSKVPVEGFKGLRSQNGIKKFTIVKEHSQDQNRLPQSHTCDNQLDLPEYKDLETMKRNLLTAIKEGKTFAIA